MLAKKLSKIIVLSAFSLPMFVSAASQGSQGASSHGSSAVTASVNTRIIITNIADVGFTAIEPGTGISQTDTTTFCVGMNKKLADRKYTMTATTANTGGSAFNLVLSGGLVTESTETIPYTVKLTDQAATTATLTSGALNNNGAAGFVTIQNLGCGGTDAQTVEISLSSYDATNNVGGSYSDTLTLLVAPL